MSHAILFVLGKPMTWAMQFHLVTGGGGGNGWQTGSWQDNNYLLHGKCTNYCCKCKMIKEMLHKFLWVEQISILFI